MALNKDFVLGILLVFFMVLLVSLTLAKNDNVIHISSCKTLDKSNVRYVIDKDLSAKETCLVVVGNNITLDGKGHDVSYAKKNSQGGKGIFGYSDGLGVYVYKSNDVVIKNLRVVNTNDKADQPTDIYIFQSKNVTLSNNDIILDAFGKSSYYSVMVLASDYVNIFQNKIKTKSKNGLGPSVIASVYISDSSSNININNNFISQSGKSSFETILGTSMPALYSGITVSHDSTAVNTENNTFVLNSDATEVLLLNW